MATWKTVLAGQILVVVALLAAAAMVSMAPPSGHPPPGEALLVVHGSWRSGAKQSAAMGRRCADGSPLFAAELDAVRASLAELGYRVRVAEADALGDETLARTDLVVHHNGGWGGALHPAERALLLAAGGAQIPIVLAGDDAGLLVRADPELARRFGVAVVRGNGRYPTTVDTGSATLTYAKEPDDVTLSATARVLAQSPETAVAWVVPGTDRAATGVFDLGLRASDLCPLYATDAEAAMARGLFVEVVRAVAGR